jgi:hypothetical protein
MEGLIELILLPQNKREAVMYAADGFGGFMSLLFITGATFMTTMGMIVITLTTVSLALTIAMKVYDIYRLMKKKTHEQDS